VRRVVARLLPTPVKLTVKRRLAGTRWFPTPSKRGTTSTVAALRRLSVALAPAPGAASAPPPLAIECPTYMFIPYKLDENGLGDYEPYALDCFLTLVDRSGPGAVYDVGANVGLYGLLAGAYSGR
jgi:hypothetical protein